MGLGSTELLGTSRENAARVRFGHLGIFDFSFLVTLALLKASKNLLKLSRGDLLELFQCSAEGWDHIALVYSMKIVRTASTLSNETSLYFEFILFSVLRAKLKI